ncbi:MAG: transposase [Tannerella sp.]|nr:transposase [Tannerella sp.]
MQNENRIDRGEIVGIATNTTPCNRFGLRESNLYSDAAQRFYTADSIAHDCESINAESTKALYQEALDRHPNAKCIYIISDNSKYYRNKSLLQWIEETKIRQIFLPPYSPDLNLIERLWKFLKKKVVNANFYRTKELFRQAVMKFFDNIDDSKF